MTHADSSRQQFGGCLMSLLNSIMVEQRLNSAREKLGEAEWTVRWKEEKATSVARVIADGKGKGSSSGR